MQLNKINSWIVAARLRTLPLAITGPITGSCMAYSTQNFQWSVAIGSLITTLLLQVLSNFANDYGDFVKGADQNRKGPARALQNNLLTVEEMKNAIYSVSLLALLSGSILVFIFSNHLLFSVQMIFFLTGLMAIYAAIKYTVGEKPYGYRGWGDAIVFLFFGLVSTVGTFVLHTGTFKPTILFPAISMGLLSTAVLNVNNIRDYNEDKQHNKQTIAVLLGIQKVRWYHVVLITSAWISLLIPIVLNYRGIWQLAFVITLPLFLKGIYTVYHSTEAQKLNIELKRLALSTFFLSLLWSLGQVIGY